jgi:predicted transcriptional regulator of viral defense system
MESEKLYKVKDWIENLQKRGIITFSRKEVTNTFPLQSEISLRNSLNRLVNRGSIVSVWKGFYVIVPLKYASRKIVPPEQYMSQLMKYLNRPYYVGLLSAAAFHGAAHQQPQDFFVITESPALRNTNKKGTRVLFLNKKKIINSLTVSLKTETGYVQISSTELTAADLITYQKETGGLNRVSTILNELAESLHFDSLNKDYFENVPVSTIQRMGYILEVILEQIDIADRLLAKAKEFGCVFQKIPLKIGNETDTFETNSKWKIIINEQIEIDD